MMSFIYLVIMSVNPPSPVTHAPPLPPPPSSTTPSTTATTTTSPPPFIPPRSHSVRGQNPRLSGSSIDSNQETSPSSSTPQVTIATSLYTHTLSSQLTI